MLRRRKKSSRPRPAAVAPAATGSRRRARADAPVPAALKLGVQPVVLVTGFEPFGGERTNPSWDIVERLPDELEGMRVVKCRAPCIFGDAVAAVSRAMERHEPALVVCLGQAGGRTRIGVERIAINVVDARIPDNTGIQPIDEPIEPDGPPAYFATLPVKAMVAAMRAAGVPAELSNSAGTYVCNYLMYGVLHFIASSGRAARAGFIHVPYSEEQAVDKPAAAGMALGTMVRGVEAAIRAAQRHPRDIRAAEGALA